MLLYPRRWLRQLKPTFFTLICIGVLILLRNLAYDNSVYQSISLHQKMEYQIFSSFYQKDESVRRVFRKKVAHLNELGLSNIHDNTPAQDDIRKLPLTYKYLKDSLDAVIMNGYNIVGDATTAAIIPLLTGKTETELPEVRKNQLTSGFVDDYPLIWNKFRSKGYATLFAEDSPSLAVFNLRFNGFYTAPTDHYMRPFWQATVQFPNPTHCNRDVHFLPLFGFLLSFLLLLYTIQLITGIHFLLWFSLFLSLHNSTCNRGIYFLPLWISIFFSLHNSTCNRGICFLLWFSFFFKCRLNPQLINFSASSIWGSRTGILLVIFLVRSCLG
ncbi:unnamed protein product [Acanthosepion pharaonis]|uniref:Uncharacterized protein n=1 Tax=Acanthosepion pharaonis TaxID=158019 RepID=A0A812CID5_ACAPH|nr:unnamed protein product [Sepia pharaonis]